MINVLITNDDGIDARGIKVLVDALKPIADVYVVAPAEEQSGKSQSITFLHPLRVEKRDMQGVVAAYAAWGTPTDCVKIGLRILEREGLKPDYIISGINLGYNTGLATYYSGTVAAAREGALNGIKSIALSVGNHEAAEFDYILEMLPTLMEMADRMSRGTLLNVNAPDLPADEIKGYRIVDTAPFDYGIRFVFEELDGEFYQMGGEPAETRDDVQYDMDVTEDGYVAVSPIPTYMTDKVSLGKLRNVQAQGEVLTVIVDAQEDVLDEIADRDELLNKLSALTHAVARMDMPLLITESYSKGETAEEIMKYASRYETVEHMHMDPWDADDMTTYTSLVDTRKVIIAGAQTHLALMQTALGFIERGYEVTILEDCAASADPEDHKRAVRELKERGCKISGMESEIMRIADNKEQFVVKSVEKIMMQRR